MGEGWGLFLTDRGFEIQRDDDANAFPDDRAARRWVRFRARLAGDERAARALRVVKEGRAK